MKKIECETHQECIEGTCKVKDGYCDTLKDCLRGFECNNNICEKKKYNPENIC